MKRKRTTWIDTIGDYKPGDPPPRHSNYADWMAWAGVQAEAGIEQARCPRCGRWQFPQEECCDGKWKTLAGRHYTPYEGRERGEPHPYCGVVVLTHWPAV